MQRHIKSTHTGCITSPTYWQILWWFKIAMLYQAPMDWYHNTLMWLIELKFWPDALQCCQRLSYCLLLLKNLNFNQLFSRAKHFEVKTFLRKNRTCTHNHIFARNSRKQEKYIIHSRLEQCELSYTYLLTEIRIFWKLKSWIDESFVVQLRFSTKRFLYISILQK